MLSSATYGVAATLLFARPLADATAGARPWRGGGGGATATPRRTVRFDSMRLGGSGQPRSVCKGHEGVMVVGAASGGDPISWMNTGDAHWRQRVLAGPVAGEPEVWGVAAHGAQFVAVGSIRQDDLTTVAAAGATSDDGVQVTFSSSRRRPTIWWTRDSFEWEGVVLDVDERHAQLVSVSCHSELLIAVGSTLDADGVQGDGAFILVSADHGGTWRRAEIASGDASLAEGSFTGVAVVDGRWFAISTDIEGGGVWTSPDGLRWSTVAGSARQFRGITLQGIDVDGDRVFLAGTGLADHRPRYYVSTDRCRTWQHLRPGPSVLAGDDTTVGDLTVMSNEVVVVGTHDGVPVIEGGAPDGSAD